MQRGEGERVHEARLWAAYSRESSRVSQFPLCGPAAFARMNGFFSKVLVVGLVGGGLYVTGDLEWILHRAGSWARGETTAATTIETASLPLDETPLPSTRQTAVQPVMPASTATASETTPIATNPSPGAPLPTGGVPLPELTHEQVHVASLRSGDRILARTTYEVVAFDLIDPRSGEAVEHRHALLSPAVATAAAFHTPRRVVLPAMLTLGQPLAFPSVNGSQDGAMPPVGAIEALGIERPVE